MNKAAIYHRPESEFAYLYTKDVMHIRVRVAEGDMKKVEIIFADPYLLNEKVTKKMTKGLSAEGLDYYEFEVTPEFSRLSYLFKLTGVDGTQVLYTDQGLFDATPEAIDAANNYFRMPFFHEIDRFKAPEWVKGTVWYQIFPERFANGDTTNDPKGTKAWNPEEHPGREDFYGGDLQGVLDHLDHFEALGVNGLYFCPIFKASSNHKYDTLDYLEIDPDFGDKKLFKKLVEECHKRGIKVMLDAVFNHMGFNSPQFQDLIKKQEKSKYADWFHVHDFPVRYEAMDAEALESRMNYDTFAFEYRMPKLNTANPEVQEFLLHIAEYWIKEFDIDAWRLDVANEIDHHFWKRFRAVCDAAKSDFYILGEIWHSSQAWLQGDEFTAVMNYAYTDAMIEHYAKKTISMDKMVNKMNAQLMLYRKQTNQMQFNVLDSHDTPRILTLAGDDKDLMKQLEALMFLQPGVPCVYYGDEFGMNGEGDPDCRKCMPWEADQQDADMFDFFKGLIAFRKAHVTDLSDSDMDWVKVDDARGVLKLRRGNVVGVFNSGEKSIKVSGDIVLSNLCTEKGTLKPKGFAFVQE